MNLINGRPSVFLSPEAPTATLPTYSERVNDFTAIASDMATPKTEVDEVDFDDPEFQESFNEWLWKTDPMREDPEAELDRMFEYYQAEADDEMTAEEEAHLCNQYDADTHENARLGDGFLHAINGDDLKWQTGVE